MELAKSVWLFGLIKMAASPATSINGGMLETIIGLPQAMDSKIGSPNPSYKDGKSTRRALLYIYGIWASGIQLECTMISFGKFVFFINRNKPRLCLETLPHKISFSLIFFFFLRAAYAATIDSTFFLDWSNMPIYKIWPSHWYFLLISSGIKCLLTG